MVDPHPLSFPNNKGGFTDGQGNKVKAGDRICYRFGNKKGRLDEALHDGDAFVTWDDGSYETVKWRHLAKEAPRRA